MIKDPIDVLQLHEVRKSKKQKLQFRETAVEYLQRLGYDTKVEKGLLGARNIVAGDPSKAKYLLTAHYDTCAAMPFPNFITPCNFWLYLGYQLLIVVAVIIFAGLLGLIAGFLIPNGLVAIIVTLAGYWAFLLVLLCGPANLHNANDNTSGVVTVLEMAKNMPEALKDQVCFVLFDLEEAGLLGSLGYRYRHSFETKKQMVLNLDCVGDGDEIFFFPCKKIRKNATKMAFLRGCCGAWENKSVTVWEKGFSVYPSDQASFPYGVGICSLRRARIGLYMDKIHTKKDVVLDEANVHLLCVRIIEMLNKETQTLEDKYETV